MASDVYALGATLLYAATGHAPYQGETVMDVLIRLATEPPDLSGLPPELTELITGCLERSPRDRPTSAALLARLGPLVSAAPHADGLAPGAPHPFLAESAMALIAGFRSRAGNGLRPIAGDTAVGDAPAGDGAAGNGAGGDADDGAEDSGDLSQASVTGFGSEASDSGHPGSTDSGRGGDTTGDGLTYASELALPVRPDAGAGHHEGWRASIPAGPAGPAAPPGPAPAPAPSPHVAALSLPVRATVACALLVAGAALGAILTGFGMSGSNSGAPSAHRTAPATRPASPPPPPPGAAPSVLPSIAPGGPPAALSLNPFGDPDTGFVIHGANWPPGTILTIALAGLGVSPDHPVADAAGSFNYTINQSHEFRRGMLPPGAYRVTVTGSGGQRATVTFDIRSVPPPGQSPPP
jgi:hypothetical protein